MTDYERGVAQASNVYKEVIREYVSENAKLRELVGNYAAMTEYLLARQPMLFPDRAKKLQELDEKRRELEIEVEDA